MLTADAFHYRFLHAMMMHGGVGGVVLSALFSDDLDDLDDAVSYIGTTSGWPDDFKDGIEGLQEFRHQYAVRAPQMSSTERAVMERYDDALTMDLVDQLMTREFAPKPSAGGLSPTPPT